MKTTTQAHIEYLQIMVEDDNEFLASEAKKELKELKEKLKEQGIFAI